jgi:hypothetical protein
LQVRQVEGPVGQATDPQFGKGLQVEQLSATPSIRLKPGAQAVHCEVPKVVQVTEEVQPAMGWQAPQVTSDEAVQLVATYCPVGQAEQLRQAPLLKYWPGPQAVQAG